MIEKTFIERGLRRIELEEFLRNELAAAGFTRSEIVKTPLVTRIIVNVCKPGLAIGKAGQNIRQLTENVEKKFGIENPQIEIKQIENPKLDAQAMVDDLRNAILRGISWRSAAHRTVRNVMAAGAQGVELILAGKLTGKGGRKRKVRIASGYMKKIGNQAKYVDYAQTAAYPKAGAIGIKLRIVRPDVVFPDKVKISDVVKEIEFKEEEAEEKEETKAEEKKEGGEAEGKEKVVEKKVEKPKEEKAVKDDEKKAKKPEKKEEKKIAGKKAKEKEEKQPAKRKKVKDDEVKAK